MADAIPFHVPYRTGGEAAYVSQVVESGPVTGNGPFTQRCQTMLRERTGAAGVLLTHSCTAALEMSALLSGVGPGDEVIVPSFAFTSTASAFLRTGASLVFAEVDPQSMALDPTDVARRITPRTRAIVPIHYAGLPCAIEALQSLATDAGAVLIEDAAQAIDCALGGVALGTFGRFGCLSFHETKNIHCGLGGALLVRDVDELTHAEHVWERGTNRAQFFRGLVDKYTWVAVGSSFYPSELDAAFLTAQLEGLDSNTAARNAIGDLYDRRLGARLRALGVACRTVESGVRTNTHGWYLVLRSAHEADALRAHLAAASIAAYSHYVPLHSSPVGQAHGFAPGDLPVTEAAAAALLRLPVHTAMTTDDAERVADAVLRFFATAG
jgi:dTDP-4-amino-4,6-dideoxygalactose transaminase